MEYVFRFLFGFAVTFVGCEIAILLTCRRITRYKQELKFHRERLTKPESYIWVDVKDHLPECEGEYLVEYVYTNYSTNRYAAIRKFYADKSRFQYECDNETRVLRWAELPR